MYRSYLPIGAEYLREAIDCAKRRRPDLADAIAALEQRLADPADELACRFQQVSGAVMAKGVEDTAYYRYSRFVALNEVGGDPARFGLGPDGFHDAARRRLAEWPAGMTTLMTHDTKRGEDVRARLAVLAELPPEWATLARQLHRLVPMPNPALGYLLWQTVVGAGLISRERLHAYAEKAMREASDGTSWADPDVAFESAVHAAVDAVYDDPQINDAVAKFVRLIEPVGWSNALGQKAVALTMPGVPDVYQGTEWWDDSLVDPDNRRAVDFESRRSVLRALDATGELPPVDRTGCRQAMGGVTHPAAAPGSPRAVQRLSTAAGARVRREPRAGLRSRGCDHGGDRTAGGAAAVRRLGRHEPGPRARARRRLHRAAPRWTGSGC